MNIWKTATVVLAVLLVVVSIICVRGRNAPSDAADIAAQQSTELTRLRLAVHDTQSYLNWYRLVREDGLTKEDFERNLVILQSKYLHHFPEWAKIQTDRGK